jgi:signal transduction histidine kinase
LDSVPACELIQKVCDTFETEALMAGLTLEVSEVDKGLRILGDPETLSRALENVVSNAIEAQPSTSGIVRVECQGNAKTVGIAVHDAGPGIEENRRSEIFDLYFTTKPHGTGVGLALVRQAVDLHNGDVRIDSRVGQGTTVTLSLPAAPAI